jgi:hypothetical protein
VGVGRHGGEGTALQPCSRLMVGTCCELSSGHGVDALSNCRSDSCLPTEEVRTATNNDGTDLRGWFTEEAVWLVAQFVKIATSVAVVRWVHQLFRIGYANESAYQRAPDLWSHGHQQQDPRFGPSGYTRTNTTWRPSAGSTPGSGLESSSSDQGANRDDADSPRYVITVEGYHLYVHRKVLNPGRQFWPCPLLYVTACESCAFHEYDRGGRPQCVALVKLRSVLDGTNAGEDLSEIREWVRNSH